MSDKRTGPPRIICLGCAQPIVPGDETGVITVRHGVLLDTGWAHRGCLGNPDGFELDVTGKPDYVGYDEDGAKPPYPPGFDAVAAGEKADANALAYTRKKQQTVPG